MHVDLDTLAKLNRLRPAVVIAPEITDAELIIVSVMQAAAGSGHPDQSPDRGTGHRHRPVAGT